jgi:hypothetical protein
LTGTQEKFLASRLEAVAPKLKSEGAYRPGEEIPGRTIMVPADGEFTIKTTEQANALHKTMTGEPLPGMPEPRSYPKLATAARPTAPTRSYDEAI